jgi:hypothetical protein
MQMTLQSLSHKIIKRSKESMQAVRERKDTSDILEEVLSLLSINYRRLVMKILAIP